ncbi:sodium ion-translocating decarboxylase subunit beta [candidate division KSB3 bacterium]|uniref:Sodium ion-translocating decarboxylase subunit beta n=1 Tax=candidate division KSB3 bacterium TaxID=2044937 RepID=A0A9D5JTQ7_9BACT|nr:sodium ion-translocating decarboxylase subunit beta [candidate division KSB3 bacterium]MBD3323501.1 sodium ion-translocating decarboxylase subunit beta [candidate division KSB3 bacterium]
MDLFNKVLEIFTHSGYGALSWGNLWMFVIGGGLLYLAIVKKFEPLLLLPIAFGAILVNLPLSGIMQDEGFLHYIYFGTQHEIFPILIFMGVGAMTDFGPLLANPITLLLGAAAQGGVFVALLGSVLLGFPLQAASAIGIIGGADGPTSIYMAAKMAPTYLGAIAVASYSYMALVPLIQPPIIRLLTKPQNRKIVMEQLRPVSRLEKILFPIVSTILVGLLLPPVVPLLGSLMFGNLMRESLVVNRLSETAQNSMINIVTIFLGLTVGGTMVAENFLHVETLKIIFLGLVAFACGTAAGVGLGNLMCRLSGGKINPMIGAAGVSAVPMAARVVQTVGQKENPANFLLMHAMGPNVAGVIGTAVAAGVFISLLQ